MRPIVTKLLEALGALLAIALLWAVAIALQGCSRPGDPPPALDCPSSLPRAVPPAPPPAAPVLEDGECHGDDCALPKPKR